MPLIKLTGKQRDGVTRPFWVNLPLDKPFMISKDSDGDNLIDFNPGLPGPSCVFVESADEIVAKIQAAMANDIAAQARAS